MNRKAISPVIATVLLIALVVVIGVIIFLWARGFVEESAQKAGRAVELSCENVNFESGVYFDVPSGDFLLDVINRGNVPLYGFDVKEIGDGTVIVHETLTSTVGVGESSSIELEDVSSGTELLVVPVILGETNSGKVAHTCDDRFGYGVNVP